MPRTRGFVGVIEVETKGTSRIWFSLTESPDQSDWIEIAGKLAWFTLNLESADRPYYMAELSLIKDALRDGLRISVDHDAVATRTKNVAGDSFETNGVRIYRVDP